MARWRTRWRGRAMRGARDDATDCDARCRPGVCATRHTGNSCVPSADRQESSVAPALELSMCMRGRVLSHPFRASARDGAAHHFAGSRAGDLGTRSAAQPHDQPIRDGRILVCASGDRSAGHAAHGSRPTRRVAAGAPTPRRQLDIHHSSTRRRRPGDFGAWCVSATPSGRLARVGATLAYARRPCAMALVTEFPSHGDSAAVAGALGLRDGRRATAPVGAAR